MKGDIATKTEVNKMAASMGLTVRYVSRGAGYAIQDPNWSEGKSRGKSLAWVKTLDEAVQWLNSNAVESK